MTITVRFFAILREKAGTGETSLDLDESATAQTAVEMLTQRFSSLAEFMAKSAIAINREYAPLNAPLHDGDELALIPPVSGG